jgi:hypothetical protein
MAGEAAQQDQSLVIYSIGNAVFNSNGEYQERGMPAYGFIVRLLVGTRQPQIQLLPIFTDNKKTFWQPRPVNEAEFSTLITHLTQQGMPVIREGETGTGWRALTVDNECRLVMSLSECFGES